MANGPRNWVRILESSLKQQMAWRHLHKLPIWPPVGITPRIYKFGHIASKFGQQVAPLASVLNLWHHLNCWYDPLFQIVVTRWCHQHWLQFWAPGCFLCTLLALHWIALLALSVIIELVSSSARVTSVKSAQRLRLTHSMTSEPIDQTPGLPGSDKNYVANFLLHRGKKR